MVIKFPRRKVYEVKQVEKNPDGNDYFDEKKIVEESSKEVKESHDVLASVIGDFGPFQMVNVILIGFPAIFIAWSNFVTKFLTQDTDFWCAKPLELSNLTTLDWINISAPMLNTGGFDRCNIFNVNFSETNQRPVESSPTISCTEWEFAKGEVEVMHRNLKIPKLWMVNNHGLLNPLCFQNTVIQRWSLVCGRSPYFKSLAQSLYFSGTFCTAPFIGFVADWFGRKRSCLIFLTPIPLMWIASYYTDNMHIWLAIRFALGVLIMGLSMSRSVYMVEFVSGPWRSKTENWFGESFFKIGRLWLAAVVYFCPDMRTMELILGCSTAGLLVIFIFLPESPRWLLANGRVDEAKGVIKKALKMNKLPESNLEKLDSYEFRSDNLKGTLLDLFKLPSTRRNMVLVSVSSFIIALCVIGLNYNTPTFDWSPTLVFAIPPFIQLVLAALVPFLQNTFGRKKLLTSFLTLTGLLLLASAPVPLNMFPYNWPVIVLAWIANSSLDVAWGTVSIFTKELFPTTHRASAFGLMAAFGRLGAVVAPYVIMLDVFNPITSLIIYSFLCLLSAILSIWIWPETKSLKLPESLEDSEKMASSKNSWVC